MKPVLCLRGISKSFPGVKALSGVDLDLYPGEVTALIGENGAGKSTIVKVLTGIYQPDEGTIEFDGQPVRFPSADAAAKAGVTAIHQETVLFDDLSVAENIWLGHAPRTRWGLIDRMEMRKAAARLLESIGATLNPDARLGDLGIASRHMVAIARALVVEPRLIVLDEPTSALDVTVQKQVLALLQRLQQERGLSYLLITHDVAVIEAMAHEVMVMKDGRVVEQGPALEVLRSPAHPYTQMLVESA